MRRLHFNLVGFAALVVACQPVAPPVVTTSSLQAEDMAITGSTIATDAAGMKKPTIKITSASTLASATAEQTSSEPTGNEPTGNETTDAQSAIDLAVSSITVAPAKATPIRPSFQPKNMVGSVAPSLLKGLGDATMIRQEGAVEIWQYRFASCVVDFFFYPTSDGTMQKIIKGWDMRATVIGDRLNKPQCLTAMERLHQWLADRS